MKSFYLFISVILMNLVSAQQRTNYKEIAIIDFQNNITPKAYLILEPQLFSFDNCFNQNKSSVYLEDYDLEINKKIINKRKVKITQKEKFPLLRISETYKMNDFFYVTIREYKNSKDVISTTYQINKNGVILDKCFSTFSLIRSH
ncbi:MAG TPA: hypothetical protein VIG94_06735 [Faecalibacter sp.]